jgi:hypothetical protein
LWDEVEAARPDCAFLVITHDLEFAASRPGRKYVIRRFLGQSNWELEAVPEDTGFGEELSTLILGSRMPILFVEGSDSSLDLAIYRACYPEWTVLPRGNATSVVHAVATMRANQALTRVKCAGLVDADDRSEHEVESLSEQGVSVLPVCEIENLFLLPEVVDAILEMESFDPPDRARKQEDILREIFALAAAPEALELVAVRYCQRRIDRAFKSIDLKGYKSGEELKGAFNAGVASIDVDGMIGSVKDKINSAIRASDTAKFLSYFDNKGLLSIAAKHLKGVSKGHFEDWLSRSIRDPKNQRLRTAIQSVLPKVTAK